MLPAITMETEASHMLEAALEQMDDIIAGKSYGVAPLSFLTWVSLEICCPQCEPVCVVVSPVRCCG